METILRLDKCKCGEQLLARHKSFISRSMPEPFNYTESYCPNRRWYNYWKHDKDLVLTYEHSRIYDNEWWERYNWLIEENRG